MIGKGRSGTRRAALPIKTICMNLASHGKEQGGQKKTAGGASQPAVDHCGGANHLGFGSVIQLAEIHLGLQGEKEQKMNIS
jgi:hypothetical protein